MSEENGRMIIRVAIDKTGIDIDGTIEGVPDWETTKRAILLKFKILKVCKNDSKDFHPSVTHPDGTAVSDDDIQAMEDLADMLLRLGSSKN